MCNHGVSHTLTTHTIYRYMKQDEPTNLGELTHNKTCKLILHVKEYREATQTL